MNDMWTIEKSIVFEIGHVKNVVDNISMRRMGCSFYDIDQNVVYDDNAAAAVSFDSKVVLVVGDDDGKIEEVGGQDELQSDYVVAVGAVSPAGKGIEYPESASWKND